MTKDKSYLSAGFDENILRNPAFYQYSGALYDNSNIGDLLSAGSEAISGDLIQAGAITQDKIEGISILGWVNALTFQALSNTKVSWLAGGISLADGTTYNIAAGDTGDMSAVMYVYFDLAVSSTVLQKTTTALNAVGANKILVMVAQNVAAGKLATFQAFGGKGEGVLITADNIAAGTITTNELAANSVKTNNLDAGAVTAAKIAAGTITADKIATGALVVGTNVGLGTAQDTSGVTSIIGGVVTTDYINSKYIIADQVSASNITAGTVVGSSIQTSNNGNAIVMNANNHLYFYNAGNNQPRGDLYASNDDFIISGQDNVYIYAGGRTAMNFGYVFAVPVDDGHYTIGNQTGKGLQRVCSYAFTNPSDRRLKKNIKTIQSALDKVMKLRGVSFEWKKGHIDSGKKQIGLIAQEVKKIVPEVVDGKGGKEKYGINYGKFAGLLIEAIKELNNKIDKLSV